MKETEKDLLDAVQHALCCPDGKCRAIIEGDPKACGANQTKDYAEAAIKLVREHDKRARTLIEVPFKGPVK